MRHAGRLIEKEEKFPWHETDWSVLYVLMIVKEGAIARYGFGSSKVEKEELCDVLESLTIEDEAMLLGVSREMYYISLFDLEPEVALENLRRSKKYARFAKLQNIRDIGKQLGPQGGFRGISYTCTGKDGISIHSSFSDRSKAEDFETLCFGVDSMMEEFDFGYCHPHFDGRSASSALRQMLDHLLAWRNELAEKVDSTDGVHPDYVDDYYANKCYVFAYRDVAFSNAAIGSIVPCFEGLFLHEFASIRQLFGDSDPINMYHRWNLKPDEFWSPSVASDKGEKRNVPDIMRGVKQLCKSLELDNYLPQRMHNNLNAIFSFRNFVLHQGYEWQIESRNRFQKLIESKKWDDWFSIATWGDSPWMFCMTDNLLTVTLDLFDELMTAFHQIRKNMGDC